MEFLTKIFPYLDIPNNVFNTIYITFMLGAFGWYAIKFIFKIWKISKDIKDLNLLTNILDNLEKIYKEEVNNYTINLISINNKQKSFQSFDKYFNLDIVLAKININVLLLQSIPSKLVGLGILGTFIGLTYGISDFNTSSQEAIKNSISTLLNGMSTAFVTSVWGMILSLIFSYCEKININKLKSAINNICDKIDEEYLITKKDELELEVIKIGNTLDKYFGVQNAAGEKLRAGKVLYELYINSLKQTEALKSFSTDLAEKIEAGFETILSKQLENNIMPLIENVANELINLRNNIKDPAGEMTTNIVKDLEKAIAKMVDELKVNITTSTKNELENVTSIIAKTSEIINEIPNSIKNTISEINKVLNILSVTINENIGTLQKTQKQLLEKQNDNITITDTLLTSLKEIIKEFNEAAKQMVLSKNEFLNVINSFENINNEFRKIVYKNENNIETIANLNNNLVNFTQDYIIRNEKIVSNLTDTTNNTVTTLQNLVENLIQKTDESMQNITQTVFNLSGEFITIKEGLISIFDQINKGLHDYNYTIDSALRNNLQMFTESVSKSVESLDGVMNGLHDLLSDLTELIEKFNNRTMR